MPKASTLTDARKGANALDAAGTKYVLAHMRPRGHCRVTPSSLGPGIYMNAFAVNGITSLGWTLSWLEVSTLSWASRSLVRSAVVGKPLHSSLRLTGLARRGPN
jgi:hypothetical protein